MLFRRGSMGPEVSQIEQALAKAGLYTGVIDGIFGGGLESAVINFQKSRGFADDGQVGDRTWSALFPQDKAAPKPAITTAPIEQRCLGLTGSFETDSPVPDCFSGLSGDFDGEGISFGALQWNFGEGSLPPLLNAALTRFPGMMSIVFGPSLEELTTILHQPASLQVDWGRSISIGPSLAQVAQPWRGLFKALGRTKEFQTIEMEAVAKDVAAARSMMQRFVVKSERALALMFDIATQDGVINDTVAAAIRHDYAQMDSGLSPDELEVVRLVSIANRRADAAKPQWRDDVRRRKLTIANGKGEVHGNFYDLEAQYGITLNAA